MRDWLGHLSNGQPMAVNLLTQSLQQVEADARARSRQRAISARSQMNRAERRAADRVEGKL